MYSVPRDWNFIKQNHAWNGYNTASMYYHNSRALEIAMKEFPEAEVVVKYRSDVVSSHTFPHAEGALDEKTIYLPNGNDYGGVNDQLAYGTPESMAVYCSLYDKIEEYVRNGVPYHPETLLSHHLRSNAIQTKRFDFAYGLEPSRHDAWN